MSHVHVGERRAKSAGDPRFDSVVWSWPLFGLALLTAVVSYVSYVALIRAI